MASGARKIFEEGVGYEGNRKGKVKRSRRRAVSESVGRCSVPDWETARVKYLGEVDEVRERECCKVSMPQLSNHGHQPAGGSCSSRVVEIIRRNECSGGLTDQRHSVTKDLMEWYQSGNFIDVVAARMRAQRVAARI